MLVFSDDFCFKLEVLLLFECVRCAFDNLHSEMLFQRSLLILFNLQLVHPFQATLYVLIFELNLLLQLFFPESLLLLHNLSLLQSNLVSDFGTLNLLHLFLLLLNSDPFECFVVRNYVFLDFKVVTLLHT